MRLETSLSSEQTGREEGSDNEACSAIIACSGFSGYTRNTRGRLAIADDSVDVYC